MSSIIIEWAGLNLKKMAAAVSSPLTNSKLSEINLHTNKKKELNEQTTELTNQPKIKDGKTMRSILKLK